jgi:hypothetical protein
MPISAISQYRKVFSRHKSKNQFPLGKAGKFSTMDVNGLSIISSFAAGTYEYG